MLDSSLQHQQSPVETAHSQKEEAALKNWNADQKRTQGDALQASTELEFGNSQTSAHIQGRVVCVNRERSKGNVLPGRGGFAVGQKCPGAVPAVMSSPSLVQQSAD